MGKIKQPEPVALIVGMISASPELFVVAGDRLKEKFGELNFISSILPFDATDYYCEEMGIGLQRRFISFERLIDPGELANIKIFTNLLEEDFSLNSKRRINLDPGYLSLSKLVLATTKDHQHRIYLRDGIYAEVTLRFKAKKFQPGEWTYPDYQTQAYLDIFLSIRKLYVERLKIRRKLTYAYKNYYKEF
ncbi:MAG: DUF4416 family protein [bacterium]|nr:DUF4416 family protein [bacterium]